MNCGRISPFPVILGGLLVATSSPAVGAEESCTGRPSNTRLYVKVSNIRSEKGLIAVTLYADDSRKFLAKRGSLYVGRVPATAPVTTACIYVPGPGIWALGVYHDENADRKLERKGIFGVPGEGYGFSNNASTLMGLPAFKSVRINVPRTDMEIGIKLKYP